MRIPYNACCPARVPSTARDRPHKRREGRETNRTPEVVFDYAILGEEGVRDTTAVLPIKGRRSHIVFAHVVPREGLAHDNRAHDAILK